MQKHFKILMSFLAAMLLGLGGCTDDFHWEGIKVEDDEFLIAFTSAGPKMEVLNATRASDADRDKISNLTLVIFKDGVLLSRDPLFFYPGNDNCVEPVLDNKGQVTTLGAIKMKKRLVKDGNWYLIANAKDEIEDYISSVAEGTDITEDNFLVGIRYGGQTSDGKTHGNDQLNGECSHVFIDSHSITVDDADQQSTVVFELSRIYSRVSVQLTADTKFYMTGARLSRYVPFGDLKCAQSSSVTTDAVSNTDGWIAPPVGQSTGATFTYAMKNEEIVTATYPYVEAAEAANDGKMMMLVKGYFNSGTNVEPEFSDDPCYYAIPLPALPANRYLLVKITGADNPGEVSAAKAEENPGGLSVVFEDAEKDIHNIVSDGENVLAVVDSLKFPASGTTAELTKQLLVKARKKGSTHPTISVELKSENNPAWIENDIPNASWTKKSITSDIETSNGLFTSEMTSSVKVKANPGSERSAVYTVTLEGTNLSVDVVVYQAGNTNINLKDVVSIKLAITGGASPTSTDLDYIQFINPGITGETGGANCKGIQPAENGGRVRNMGLHMPMPNGGNVTYTYKIQTKGSFKIYEKGVEVGASKNYVYNDKDTPTVLGGSSKYSYATKSDVIEISDGTISYTFDLYHTGFFHGSGTDWRYYEVVQQGDRDLYWLDRNLGAESAGMGVLKSDGILTSRAWPIVGDKAMGGYYNLTEAKSACPKGWSVPSYAQMRSMTVSAGFTINRMATDPAQVPFLAPTLSFEATEDDAGKRYDAYFPQNRLEVSGNVDGDPDAGYYLTTTGAGTAGWYQTMQFVGMNVTSQNINYNTSKASVRCCAGSYDPTADAISYTCNVKGYTHVFLYYLNSDNTKTYLTTWPGDQIAMATDISRYHPFEIQPTMNYNEDRLYVIFNTVDADGNRTNSNMSDDDVNKRQGTKFVNGGSYDLDKTPKLPDVKEGNWEGNDNADYSGKSVYLRGEFGSGTDWNTGKQATTDTKGKVKYTSVDLGKGEFKIYANGTWYSTGGAVATGDWVSVGTANNNMTVSGAADNSTYDIEWDNVNKKIKITLVGGSSGGEDDYKYIIRGKIWSDYSSGDWINNTNDLQEVNGKWCYLNVTVKEGSFGIAKYKKTTSIAHNSTTQDQEAWLGCGKSVDPGPTANTTKNFIVTENGGEMSISAGTYNFEFDPSTSTLSVTRKSGTTPPPVGLVDRHLKWNYKRGEVLAPKVRIDVIPDGCYTSSGASITNMSIHEGYDNGEGNVYQFDFKIPSTATSGKIQITLIKADGYSRGSTQTLDLSNEYITYWGD